MTKTKKDDKAFEALFSEYGLAKAKGAIKARLIKAVLACNDLGVLQDTEHELDLATMRSSEPFEED